MNTIVRIHDRIKIRKYEDICHEFIMINVNGFTEFSAKDFRTSFDKAHKNAQPIIPVIIDSYGGDVYSLLSMISIIENSQVPVMTIVEGKAMSAGAVLSGFGTSGYRYIDKNAAFMLHDISNFQHGKLDELISATKETARLNELVFTKLASKCGQYKSYFKNLINGRADIYLTPKQVVQHKLADKIGNPNIELSLNWNIKIIQ